MQFCSDILIGHHREKNEKIINSCIEEWYTSMPYDIFWNQSTYKTVCLLLDIWNRTDNCIAFFGKWIFDSNLKVVLPLTQDSLNYTCCGNETDENKFVGVFHKIIAVSTKFVQRRLNMK